MIVFSMCEEDLERIMRHPAAMIGSDGIKIMQANTSTYLQVQSITIELDDDDLGCP